MGIHFWDMLSCYPDELLLIPVSQVPAITDFPTPSGLTEVQAIKLCTDALKNSATVRQCVSHTGLNFFNEVGSCVDDLRVSILSL